MIWIRLDAETVVHICDRGRSKKCASCGKRSGKMKLCDFPVDGGTCDAECCSACARHVGPDRDYCPKHEEDPMVDFDSKLKPRPAPELAALMFDKVVEVLAPVGDGVITEARPAGTEAVRVEVELDRKRVVNFYRQRLATLYRALHAEDGKCKGCGASVWWVPMPSGKTAPFTVDGINHFAGSCG